MLLFWEQFRRYLLNAFQLSDDFFFRVDVTFDKSDLCITNDSFLHFKSHKLFQFF